MLPLKMFTLILIFSMTETDGFLVAIARSWVSMAHSCRRTTALESFRNELHYDIGSNNLRDEWTDRQTD